MNEAKEFYDNKGEWSGVFKMNPLAWASGGEGICHIRYWYSPVPGSYRTDSGIDYRTFHFQIDRSDGTWKAYSMGDYHSGTLIGEK